MTVWYRFLDLYPLTMWWCLPFYCLFSIFVDEKSAENKNCSFVRNILYFVILKISSFSTVFCVSLWSGVWFLLLCIWSSVISYSNIASLLFCLFHHSGTPLNMCWVFSFYPLYLLIPLSYFHLFIVICYILVISSALSSTSLFSLDFFILSVEFLISVNFLMFNFIIFSNLSIWFFFWYH